MSGRRARWRYWQRVVGRDDIDLVDVAVPSALHRDIQIAAAKAGKHIFCEKPLATTVAEAEEMVRAVEQAGVTHMIAHHLGKVPALLTLRLAGPAEQNTRNPRRVPFPFAFTSEIHGVSGITAAPGPRTRPPSPP